jgi:hypothetical protein
MSRISGFEYVLKMTKHKCLQEVAKCLHMLTLKVPKVPKNILARVATIIRAD